MPHPTGPTDENLRKLIVQLRRTKEKPFTDVARYLEKSRRSKKVVNVGRLAKLGGKEDTLIVPGKVLGVGEINKSINVYAWSFSREAKQKIQKAGGQTFYLNDLVKDKPKARIVI
mgnify:CR=1 FL=1